MSSGRGKEYLERISEQYQIARTTLPRLPDDEFEKVRKESRRKEIGVESFMMDFAIDAERRRRNLERWAVGRDITPATTEHAAAIISALPSFTIANSEAMGAIRVEETKRFMIDAVSEDIIEELARRLPRRVDAYRYHQDYAHESIDIPGLGEVKVTLHQIGDGIFSTIGTVEGERFKIWNCRRSGVEYMDRYSDISRPNTVILRDSEGSLPHQAKTMQIDLYDDESGIFVELDGKRFTNSRVYTAEGRGYMSDWQRDDLHRTYTGGNDMDPKYAEVNKDWRGDKTELSWREVENEAIIWLVENVLDPIRETSKPDSQATIPPEEEPFPEGKIGPLFTFVDEDELKKIFLIKSNQNKAYPEERKAVRSSLRLLPYGTPRRNAPEIVHDGYVWCGVGFIDHETDIGKLREIGKRYRKEDSLLGSEGVAVVKPKTTTNVYVVDWQAWDDYREKTFTDDHDRLTDDEYIELQQVFAETIVPIGEYQGDFKQPIILIGRDLELDEIEAVYLPPKPRDYR